MEVSSIQPSIDTIEFNAPLNLANVPMGLSVVGTAGETSGCLKERPEVNRNSYK
jgi:hypothetical protein